MTFDGRRYLGASLVQPITAHSEAPAIGDALLQSQIAGFFASQHRSKMIGNQTYAWRRVYRSPEATIVQPSGVDVAEWPDVHMPTHATHVGVQVYFEHPEGAGEALAYHRVIVSDGTNTDTGDELSISLEGTAEPLEFTAGGIAMFSAYAFVELANVTQPGSVSVRLTGYAQDLNGTHDWAYTPRAVTAWRWTV
jgi:hypothetical protein